MEKLQTTHPLVAAQHIGEPKQEEIPKMSPDGKRMRVQILSGEGSKQHMTSVDGRNYVRNGAGQLINADRVVRGKKAVKLYKKLRRLKHERS